jgi:hypothetical protein|tara:strand:+ start:213 stop:983 length:771 start_codon:yes stop_codon:yes gene_type:complete
MKKLYLIFIISSQLLVAQETSSFQGGEWLKFRLSYSGWLKAGNATLEVFDDVYNNIPVYKVVAKGWTTGPLNWVFKVEDHYESHFDKQTGLPYKFVRNTYEGGYTKNRIIDFDRVQNKAYINDVKEQSTSSFNIENDIQDLVSAYYFLRNNYETELLKKGDIVKLNIFFDSETFPFKLKYLGQESIKTSFGKIKCIKFRPYVMAGRVFKEEESLTLWVTADANKVPIKISATLDVGSLRADLVALKGLRHPFEIQF